MVDLRKMSKPELIKCMSGYLLARDERAEAAAELRRREGALMKFVTVLTLAVATLTLIVAAASLYVGVFKLVP